jgi:hypothetical protein
MLPVRRNRCGVNMGKQKKARKYATMKRMLSLRDESLKKNRLKPKKKKKEDSSALKEREAPPANILPVSSSNIMLSWAHLTNFIIF